jgi:hypothetical protein
MTRLVQIRKGDLRRVAVVEEPSLRLLADCKSVYELAQQAIATNQSFIRSVRERVANDLLDYDPIYNGQSPWQILPAIDHPTEPTRCMVSGTGLTHLGSARGRHAMHALPAEEMTDSMKMFRWGVEGGRPPAGLIGTPPEWFYKGTGTSLRAHGEPLEIPGYAEDGGEEAEIAGVYVIAADGQPRRVGLATANEFSDHRFEKKNYLNLAGSKLRTCSLGPELVVDPQFDSVPVQVTIERGSGVLWCKQFRTGEAEMCHSLQNVEHHHFKFEAHRRPGDVHVHFFGTDCLSFGDGIQLQDGDTIQIAFEGFGRPLRNPVRAKKSAAELVRALPLE